MSFINTLDSGNYSPTLCVRGGVRYNNEHLSPDSGLYIIDGPLPNWSFYNSLISQNSRIRGKFDYRSNFNVGYFDFEEIDGNIIYSKPNNLGVVKSGYIYSGSATYQTDFWGLRKNHITNTLLSSLQNPKNICSSIALSGTISPLVSFQDSFGGIPGEVPSKANMVLYPQDANLTGGISGDVTLYGRLRNCNQTYEYEDKIFEFYTPPIIPGGGGGTPRTEGFNFADSATNDSSNGESDTWNNPSYVSSNDGNEAWVSISPLNNVSQYLLITDFDFVIPSDATIDGIEVVIKKRTTTVGVAVIRDNEVKLVKGGIIGGTNLANISEDWVYNFLTDSTYGGPTELWGQTWTYSDINATNFGIAISARSIHEMMGGTASIDSVSIKVYYTQGGGGGSGSINQTGLALVNTGQGGNRKLKWKFNYYSLERYIDMPNFNTIDNDFINFLMIYNSSDGYVKCYLANDFEPFRLEANEYIGNATDAFGNTSVARTQINFYGDYPTFESGKTNPKIITEFGIGSAWNPATIRQFDEARLNGAYFITENPQLTHASPSGLDTSYLQFHFPSFSSGTLGSCHSGLYRNTSYSIPLNSGISENLYEFDRSQFNNNALTLDLWVENTGTNPSGNLNSSIDFCELVNQLGINFYNRTTYWSGYPVQIPNGIHQIRMSGLFFNSENNPSDLIEVGRNRANQALLNFGAYYDNIHRNYSGDIRVYSARVNLDGFVTPSSIYNNIPLYCSGIARTSDSCTLYVENSYTFHDCSLYINGKENNQGYIPLSIAGAYSFDDCTLVVKGKDTNTENTTLYIDGGAVKAGMNLYTYSAAPSVQSGNTSLFIYSTANSGLFNKTPLYIGSANSGNKSAGMNLYLYGQPSASTDASMNLFLKRDPYSDIGCTTLFCRNDFNSQSSGLNLFLKAPSGTLGAVPYGDSMNLFINREIESIAHNTSLYISGPNESTSATTIYIKGANIIPSSIPLYANGIGVDEKQMKLYIHGF